MRPIEVNSQGFSVVPQTKGVGGEKRRKRRGDKGDQRKRLRPGGSFPSPLLERASTLTSITVDAASVEDAQFHPFEIDLESPEGVQDQSSEGTLFVVASLGG